MNGINKISLKKTSLVTKQSKDSSHGSTTQTPKPSNPLPMTSKPFLGQYYREEKIHTRFGRQASCSPFHALNYVLQSHSSDNCLERVNKINVFLRDRKSYVAFTIHDCCIIDLHRDDRHLIPQLKEIFEDTRSRVSSPQTCHIGRKLR